MINFVKFIVDEYLRLMLVYLCVVRDENVWLMETFLKKTEESFVKEARNVELE